MSGATLPQGNSHARRSDRDNDCVGMIYNFLVGRSNGNPLGGPLEAIKELARDGGIRWGQVSRMRCGAKRAQAGDD